MSALAPFSLRASLPHRCIRQHSMMLHTGWALSSFSRTVLTAELRRVHVQTACPEPLCLCLGNLLVQRVLIRSVRPARRALSSSPSAGPGRVASQNDGVPPPLTQGGLCEPPGTPTQAVGSSALICALR